MDALTQPFLLQRVFSFLSDSADFGDCMRVCKAWHAAMPERYVVVVGPAQLKILSQCRRTLCDAYPGGINQLVVYERRITSWPLELPKYDVFLTPEFCWPLRGAQPRRLKILDEHNFRDASPAPPIRDVVKTFVTPRLTGLDIRECESFAEGDVARICAMCPHVRVLTISGCKNVGTPDLVAVFRIPSLLSLDISWLDLTGMPTSSVNPSSLLKSLKAVNCRLDYERLRWLSDLVNLEAIELWHGCGGPETHGPAAEVLAGLPKLSVAVTNEWSLADLLTLCRAPALRVLHATSYLSWSAIGTSAALLDILTTGSKIQFIALTRKLYVTTWTFPSPRAIKTAVLARLPSDRISVEVMTATPAFDLRYLPPYSKEEVPRANGEVRDYISRTDPSNVPGPCPFGYIGHTDPLLDEFFESVIDTARCLAIGKTIESGGPSTPWKRKKKKTGTNPMVKKKRCVAK